MASTVSQSVALELSTTLDLPGTSVLDYAWHIVPFEGKTIVALIAYLSVTDESGRSHFALTIITAFTLPPVTEAGNFALAS